MCHQSVGLVQGAIERAGIATISVTVRPEITVNLRVPRAAYIRFPTGNPVGQAAMPNQQRTILRGVLQALESIAEPGTVVEMPYRWKRMGDDDAAMQRVPPDVPAGGRDESVYRQALRQVREIERRYGELMEAIDRYQAFLEAERAQESDGEPPDPIKLQAINPQLTYMRELREALDNKVHDALIRVSDRVVRIGHWEEGVFL